MSQSIKIAIVGHVDHGKSTILGKLLSEAKILPKGKIQKIKEKCLLHKKKFEYSFLLDSLKDEQFQNITIDMARCFFTYKNKKFMFLDAPGHSEFIKNMVTGAAKADAALFVIDATEGIKENSRRHCYLLNMLSIKQVIVIINKIDLIKHDQKRILKLQKEAEQLLLNIGIQPNLFLPVSGAKGDNIVKKSSKTSWYDGKSLLEAIYDIKKNKCLDNLPLRVVVQDVYNFTANKNSKRIIVGKVESGQIKVNDDLVFLPYGNSAIVKSIEIFNKKKRSKSYS